jgi:energy-coupling factor transporter ATP-binding protein EcfA2
VRITEFEFLSTQRNWKLEPIRLSDLTLLVGLSGVGKTRILKSIASVATVASGKSISGAKWKMSFTDQNHRQCIWEGEYERLEDDEVSRTPFQFVSSDEDPNGRKRARIMSERLLVDNELVVTRTEEQIQLGNQKMPKLSPYESVLSSLKEEDQIKPVSLAFERISKSEGLGSGEFDRAFAVQNTERVLKKYSNMERVREAVLPPLVKLFLAKMYDEKIFADICERYFSVFPSVEDVAFEQVSASESLPFFGGLTFLKIKEKGVEDYVSQADISSGMLRTLVHLSELYLSPRGTVLLVDEFENSLGINCIDAVTEDLLDASSSIQFIITSHHPYIINNVDSSFWKIVRRTGSVVQAIDAKEIGIGTSSHEAFLQLLNSQEYSSGITSLVKIL